MCQAQEQRPGETGRTGRSGGWETGKACAASAQPGVAKRESGRKGWVVSSQKPLGNLQQQGSAGPAGWPGGVSWLCLVSTAMN